MIWKRDLTVMAKVIEYHSLTGVDYLAYLQYVYANTGQTTAESTWVASLSGNTSSDYFGDIEDLVNGVGKQIIDSATLTFAEVFAARALPVQNETRDKLVIGACLDYFGLQNNPARVNEVYNESGPDDFDPDDIPEEFEQYFMQHPLIKTNGIKFFVDSGWFN